MATGGELLVRGLEAAGVRVVFGLPGVHNLPAWKAFASSSIRLVGVRHEQAAVYAADGYARATGRLGVAITTTGPGAANTLGAVGEAWASRSPVLIIATDIPRSLRQEGVYRGVLHETTDQAGMFVPVTKATMRVLEPVEVRAAVEIAAFQALDAPSRPVYLEIPTDTLAEDVPGTHLQADVTDDRLRVPGPQELDAAAAAIAEAERPVLWIGGGAISAQAGPEIAMLAERLAAPVITTYQARGILGADHPCAVGLPPHLPAVGALWDEADLIVAIGTDFDGMMTQNWLQPPPPRLITVNVDPVDAAKSYPVEINLVGDATRTVGALVQRVADRDALEAVGERLASLRSDVREELRAEHPAELMFLDVFAEAVGDAIVVADMCIAGYWLGALHPVPRPRALAYPVGWGTLGFAFPAALGPALAGIGPVVSVSGDGGFLFACGELATMQQEQIPLTAVIVDDGGYGMLRYDQQHAGDPTFGVDLHTPDFVALARSFGIEAEGVDGLGEDFGAALARHVAMDAPSVLVATARLDPPPTTSPRWYRKAGS